MKQNYYIKNTFSKFIEVRGQESGNFLQGLITHNIYKCNNKTSIYSCFLSPQGKFLADFFIVKFNNHYLIEINEKYFDSFYSKLKMYKLRSQVEFKENIDLLSIIIFSNHFPIFSKNTIFYNDPRNNNLGVKVYIDKESNDLKLITKLKEYEFDIYKQI